jgi:hypothetical protein
MVMLFLLLLLLPTSLVGYASITSATNAPEYRDLPRP